MNTGLVYTDPGPVVYQLIGFTEFQDFPVAAGVTRNTVPTLSIHFRVLYNPYLAHFSHPFSYTSRARSLGLSVA